MSSESAISLLRYICVRMSDLNLILGGNLIRVFKVRAYYFGLILRFDRDTR